MSPVRFGYFCRDRFAQPCRPPTSPWWGILRRHLQGLHVSRGSVSSASSCCFPGLLYCMAQRSSGADQACCLPLRSWGSGLTASAGLATSFHVKTITTDQAWHATPHCQNLLRTAVSSILEHVARMASAHVDTAASTCRQVTLARPMTIASLVIATSTGRTTTSGTAEANAASVCCSVFAQRVLQCD